MKTSRLVAASIAFLFGTVSATAEAVPLADASASASVRAVSEPEGYRVSVAFVPVTTLDDVSNAEMTEILAQFYAEEALTVFLHAPKAVSFTRIKSSNKMREDGRVQWSWTIPAGAVADAPEEVIEKREEATGTKSSSGKTDARTKLLDFRSSCFKDLRVAETVFSDEASRCRDESDKTALRERIAKAFSALEEKIDTDGDLFRSEKKELRDRAAKVKAFLFDEIGGGAGESESTGRTESLPVSDATFVEPFGALLRADPILLKSGGARIVERKDGSFAVLAVGSAMAANDNREKIAEMQAAAALSKLRGEEVVTEDELVRNYERTTKDGITSETASTERKSKTSLFSMDFHKPGETVGTWLSPDGKRFFLAKGRIVKTP